MLKFPNTNTRIRWLCRTATLSVAAAAAFACSDRTTHTVIPTGLSPSQPKFDIIGYGSGLGYTFDINGAQWTSGFDVSTSVGTGVIRPFLDLGAQGNNTTEEGFNTDNDAFVYDQHRTSATNALPLNYVPVFSGPAGYGHVREVVLDAHESDGTFKINEFAMYLCFSDAARTYSLESEVIANCKPVYTIAGATPAPPILAVDSLSSGSGNVFDYRVLIPDAMFQAAANAYAPGTQLCEYDPSATAEAACHQYVILWSNMSDVDATFEEFSTILRPAVRITKTPDAGTVDAGNDITFTMVVTSSGGTSTAVTLSDPLPTGVTWSSSTTTAGSCSITGSPQVLNCNLGDIAAGATVTVTVTAHTTQTSCAVYNNTATVTSTTGGDDSDNGSITVQNCHGTLIIKKISNGGTGTFNFTSASNALPSPAVSGAFSLTTVTAGTAVQQSFSVLAGTAYGVSETAQTGWTFTGRVCVVTTAGDGTSSLPADGTTQPASITVGAGATVTCTYTNTKQAILRIVKSTDPDGDPTDFTFTPTNWNGGATFTRRDNQDAFSSGFLAPGATNYDAVESVPAGWALASTACVLTGTATAKSYTAITNGVRVNLNAGEDVTCTFNDTKQAVLRIAKSTNPDGDPTDFTFTPTNWNGGATFTRRDNQAAFASGPLAPGATNYDAVETVPAGWVLTSTACVLTGTATAKSYTSITNGVRVNLNAGEDVTCTFTDTKQAILRIAKSTNPDGDPTDFTFTPTNWNGGTTFTRRDNQTAFPSGFLAPGSTNYDAVESVPAHWVLTGRACVLTGTATAKSFTSITNGVRVNLNAGEDVTCTFTDTKLPTLTVIKYLKGTSSGFDFMSTGGLSPSTFTLTPPGIGCTAPAGSTCDQITFQDLTVGGTYTVTEGAKTGYVLTDLNCTLHPGTYDPTVTRTVSTTLGAGENETCSFYNEEVVGSTTRTQGFWATHSGLLNAVWFGGSSGGHTYPTPAPATTQICFDPNPHNLSLTTLGEVLGGFWSGISQTSTKAKRSDLDQARMQLLQQLLAAIANNLAFSSVPSGSISIADAKAAFCGTDIDAIKAAMSAMAAFNTSGDNGLFTPGASANGKLAKSLANIPFWDTLIP